MAAQHWQQDLAEATFQIALSAEIHSEYLLLSQTWDGIVVDAVRVG